MQGLVKALSYEKDVNVQKEAADALAGIGDAHVVDLLITALTEGDGSTRQVAADALGQIGDGRAVEPLLTALKDPHAGVRRDAIEALGKIGDARAVEPLMSALWARDDRYGHMRRAAAVALGTIGDARAVTRLISTLDDLEREGQNKSTERDERYSQGLKQLADEGQSVLGNFLTGSLVDHLEGQRERELMEAVVKALEQIGTPEAIRRAESFHGHMVGPTGKLPG